MAALKAIGDKATTRQIAERLGLDANGVAQSLGVLPVIRLGGKGANARWIIDRHKAGEI